MKKQQKQIKKAMLSVKTETIRDLSSKEMGEVAGGTYTNPSQTTNKCQYCAASHLV